MGHLALGQCGCARKTIARAPDCAVPPPHGAERDKRTPRANWIGGRRWANLAAPHGKAGVSGTTIMGSDDRDVLPAVAQTNLGLYKQLHASGYAPEELI